MLWGGFLAELIDRRLMVSAGYLLIMAALTFFGIIHSASPDGLMYLPGTLDPVAQKIPYQFALAYAVLAAMFFLLAFTRESREPAALHD
jgi:AGZA family xanthine/uracil permease-like MFS transporter